MFLIDSHQMYARFSFYIVLDSSDFQILNPFQKILIPGILNSNISTYLFICIYTHPNTSSKLIEM